jgi:hypothetical protein
MGAGIYPPPFDETFVVFMMSARRAANRAARDVTLCNIEGGGLRARLELPV